MPVAPKTKLKAESPAEGDHRKRRRNRTTQACVNCHNTKRMCDRKRPCSRCSQLGLTGNCVYEVDDPSRQGKQDEETRMKSRIAELEGVIRELKNKPHPRWIAEKGRAAGASEGIQFSLHPSEGYPTTNVPPWSFPPAARTALPNFPSAQAPVQFSFVSHEKDSMESLLSMCAGRSEHLHVRLGGTCGCLTEAECYGAGLDLSVRLRRVAEALVRSPSHANNSNCALAARVSELDMMLTDTLLRAGLGSKHAISSTPLNQLYASNATSAWDLESLAGFNDDYLSWMPSRPNSL
ncbi:hypothetical protein B0H16DRAFT_1542875 [Mycena metata]|uniref:Zn(2)-C6 fungal-type domain-containing protein n=1 Tax=Mycena metata TaxID=1033252 RepID=A0AAD7J2S8_9AGAR|nr:hypothetical protein B0H16DRAFT_1542875 [Mycena metata]